MRSGGRVLKVYDRHEFADNPFHWSEVCERCGEGEDFWSDPVCEIWGYFSVDGKVLLSTNAEKEWLKDHWEDLQVRFGVVIDDNGFASLCD